MGPARLAVGAMSGTSADGVDVAVVRAEGAGHDMSACCLLHHHRPYDAGLRRVVHRMREEGRAASLVELAELAREISLVYAAAVNEALLMARLECRQIACVAAHGQTLMHRPPLTMQVLDPFVLAAESGCTVVSDFRRADCAAGGQGAPLVPLADYILFRHPRRTRLAVNIGGIANITFLPAGGGIDRVMAFDTGPGNCISDWLMRRFEPDGPGYDVDGRRAARGRVLEDVLHRMLAAPYFAQPPPKSTDGPAMIELFDRAAAVVRDAQADDLLATACCATALALADAVHRFLPARPDEVIISGGGTRNRTMMANVRESLAGVPIITTDELGIYGPAREAMAFALLGLATLDGRTGNVPSATGARRAVVLGTITPRP